MVFSAPERTLVEAVELFFDEPEEAFRVRVAPLDLAPVFCALRLGLLLAARDFEPLDLEPLDLELLALELLALELLALELLALELLALEPLAREPPDFEPVERALPDRAELPVDRLSERACF